MENKLKKMTDLGVIPGIGPKTSRSLRSIGINWVENLKGKKPEMLYNSLCREAGTQIDRCLLYVLRCAVYYASHKKHKPRLLLWWNWKD